MTRTLSTLLVVALAACTHKATTPVGGDGSGSAPPPKDTRTPYQVRRDATCGTLGPRMTACAVADAKAALAAGKITKADFDASTKQPILDKNTAETIAECKKIQTTYQLRVVEVCQEQEHDCDPLAACLGHLNDPPPAAKP